MKITEMIVISLKCVSEGLIDDVNIGSGNGVVLSGNKSLPQLLLTNIHNAIWHHEVVMS